MSTLNTPWGKILNLGIITDQYSWPTRACSIGMYQNASAGIAPVLSKKWSGCHIPYSLYRPWLGACSDAKMRDNCVHRCIENGGGGVARHWWSSPADGCDWLRGLSQTKPTAAADGESTDSPSPTPQPRFFSNQLQPGWPQCAKFWKWGKGKLHGWVINLVFFCQYRNYYI